MGVGVFVVGLKHISSFFFLKYFCWFGGFCHRDELELFFFLSKQFSVGVGVFLS